MYRPISKYVEENDKHFNFIDDDMYISKILAKLLLSPNKYVGGYRHTDHCVRYYGSSYCRININIRFLSDERLKISGENEVNLLSFGDFVISNKLLGRSAKKKVFDYIVEFYYNSNLNRLGKIKKLLSNE